MEITFNNPSEVFFLLFDLTDDSKLGSVVSNVLLTYTVFDKYQLRPGMSKSSTKLPIEYKSIWYIDDQSVGLIQPQLPE